MANVRAPSTRPIPMDLPASQLDRIRDIRAALIRNVNKSVRTYDRGLAKSADVLTRKILAVVNQPATTRNKAIRALMRDWHGRTSGQLAKYVGQQIQDAAGYADRLDEQLRAYRVAERHALKIRPGPNDIKAVSDYETYFLQNYSKAGADAATAYAKAEAERVARDEAADQLRKLAKSKGKLAGRELEAALRRQGARKAKAVTEGDRLAIKHLRVFTGSSDISSQLHGAAIKQSDEATRIVMRSIRESENVGRAAREMQRLLKDKGLTLAKNDQLPRLIDQLQQAGKQLARNEGDPAAMRQWRKQIAKIQQYQKQLVRGGTVQNGYVELLQHIASDKTAHRRIGKTVKQWSYWKQRYRAEAWIKTESATAFRSAQLHKDKGKKWITAYRWRMYARTHSAWTSRGKTKAGKGGPGKSKKLGGAHCICEVMDGQILTKAVAQQYPRMGHPHCNCTLEPIMDKTRLHSDEPDQEFDDWFESTGGSTDL